MVAGKSRTVDGPTGGLVDAIAKLPIDQRTAVVLRYWGGLRDGEIAEAMNIRPGTARSHLSRATTRLRKELL
jgi:RNA polymerase sigma factor (sigma-70 family)